MEIKSQTAIYTGGGIYLYYGQFTDGSYFLSDDIWESFRMLNANPMERTGNEYLPYVADDVEWQEKHLIRDVNDKALRIKLLEKLINEGCTFDEANWNVGDIESRLRKMKGE